MSEFIIKDFFDWSIGSDFVNALESPQFLFEKLKAGHNTDNYSIKAFVNKDFAELLVGADAKIFDRVAQRLRVEGVASEFLDLAHPDTPDNFFAHMMRYDHEFSREFQYTIDNIKTYFADNYKPSGTRLDKYMSVRPKFRQYMMGELGYKGMRSVINTDVDIFKLVPESRIRSEIESFFEEVVELGDTRNIPRLAALLPKNYKLPSEIKYPRVAALVLTELTKQGIAVDVEPYLKTNSVVDALYSLGSPLISLYERNYKLNNSYVSNPARAQFVIQKIIDENVALKTTNSGYVNSESLWMKAKYSGDKPNYHTCCKVFSSKIFVNKMLAMKNKMAFYSLAYKAIYKEPALLLAVLREFPELPDNWAKIAEHYRSAPEIFHTLHKMNAEFVDALQSTALKNYVEYHQAKNLSDDLLPKSLQGNLAAYIEKIQLDVQLTENTKDDKIKLCP